jgi:isochorismate pyruvate lyase
MTIPIEKQCTEMHELRVCIDELDEQITDFIALRTRYMAQAARIKTDMNKVVDMNRVEFIVDKVRNRMLEQNGPATVIESMYRALIYSCIEYEHKEFLRLRKENESVV